MTLLVLILYIRTWSKTGEELKSLASRNRFERFVQSNDDSMLISGHARNISWSIESFTVCFHTYHRLL